MKWQLDEYWLSDESADLDHEAVHRLLATTSWAAKRPRERTDRAIRASFCFSLKRKEEQIGFARVLSDGGCYAILLDFVIDEAFRGRGLGRWMLERITAHREFEGMMFILWTSTQVDFYKACGLTHEATFQVMRQCPHWAWKKG